MTFKIRDTVSPSEKMTVEERASQMWRVHPKDLDRLGYLPDDSEIGTRQRFYLHHLKNAVEQAVANMESVDDFWKEVVGEAYTPVVIKGIKHLGPRAVKPVFEEHRGTAVADVIVGLIFAQSIALNREKLLMECANERLDEANAEIDRLRCRSRSSLFNVFRSQVT